MPPVTRSRPPAKRDAESTIVTGDGFPHANKSSTGQIVPEMILQGVALLILKVWREGFKHGQIVN
jgi:hypothetical protein